MSNLQVIMSSDIGYKDKVYNNKLPILARKEYLETKSDFFGCFISDDYILSYFIDKKLIFTRLVFTIAPFLYSENPMNNEIFFLNNVLEYIKEHNMCDFIYKAQSNVVFDTCPENAECVPWGTYQVLLNKTENELFASFNQKSRNVIRKAIKSGAIVERSEDYKAVYENIKSTLERQKSIHFPSLDYLKKLHNIKENAALFIVKKDDIIQGSLVLLFDNIGGYAMYAGSIKRPLTGSLDLLHFEVMKFLQQKKVLKYDFVGTRINIKKGSKQEGIDRFKRKFNPVLIKGYTFKTVIKPFKYYLYLMFSGLYFKVKGVSYTDPIEEIQQEERYNTILLMGPRFNKKNSNMISGTIVLFEDLIEQFNKNKVNYSVIDTNKANYTFYFMAYFVIVYNLIYKSKISSKILLNSSTDYLIFGPILLLLAKFSNKIIILRKFGGDAKDIYLSSSYFKQKYLQYLFLNFDKLFFETKYLVNFFSQYNKHTYWFPNVRHKSIEVVIPRKYRKKFVFISHVVKAKGIEDILKASVKLDASYHIDIYGPLLNGEYSKKDFEKYDNVSYKGVILANEVAKQLNQYDVILLPSYKEGYPGIILEAYSLGIPVITTKLESILEIVDNYKTGILINKNDVNELLNAIHYFDQENYVEISKKAYEKFDTFESDKVFKSFFDNL